MKGEAAAGLPAFHLLCRLARAVDGWQIILLCFEETLSNLTNHIAGCLAPLGVLPAVLGDGGFKPKQEGRIVPVVSPELDWPGHGAYAPAPAESPPKSGSEEPDAGVTMRTWRSMIHIEFVLPGPTFIFPSTGAQT